MLTMRRRVAASFTVAGLAVFGYSSFDTALADKGGNQPSSPGNSAAVISASFSSDCTDFSTTSDKDLSHVVLTYTDGSSTYVGTFSDPKAYSVSGDQPISTAEVKSGTTDETFTCTPTSTNNPPPANPCEHGGAVSLVSGKDEWTLAKAGYYVVQGTPAPLKDPMANGQLSSQLEAADAPEPVKRGTHEAACAVSLVDGH